jgi:UDP-N-acetylglucosamine 2-epimerase (non-hydrolysing)
MIRLLFIFGTRPEAIKLAPVIRHMKFRPKDFCVRVCVTAQHRGMLDQVLKAFDITPDSDLDIMLPGQTLYQSTSRIIAGLEPVLAGERPDMVLVQGDTTTTLCGALAAFYAGVPVGHVEAGLRTGNMRHPFPEEMNRVLTTRLTTLHFASTAWAADNLRAEGITEDKIFVTGNTAIDSVLHVKEALESGNLEGLDNSIPLDSGKKLILVTAHRRESFGEGLEQICAAILRLAEREDLQIVFPVHPNPKVTTPVRRLLGKHPRIILTDPLSYVPFVDLMRRADILLTDSGGIQEEGPSLGKPVLVMRLTTERPEGVKAGVAFLVGTDPSEIVGKAEELLATTFYKAQNPYGDGRASGRITSAINAYFRTTC